VKWLLKILCLVGALCALSPAWAVTPTLDVGHSPGQGERLAIDILVSDQLPTDDGPAARPTDGAAWVSHGKRAGTLGFEYKGIWTRTALHNDADRPVLAWVHIADAYTDFIDCFVQTDDHEVMVYRVGDHRLFEARPILYPDFLIPVSLLPDSTATLHCLVRNNGSTSVTFQYWLPEHYALAERADSVFRAVCYGALGFTIVVALALALVTGNTQSFMLAAELLPVLVATATREGDAFQLLWPHHPEFNLPPYAWILIGLFTASMVFQWLIQPKAWEARVIRFVMAACALMLLVAAVFPTQGPLISSFVQWLGVVLPAMLLIICLRHWHEGAVARLLAMGMVVQLVALTLSAAGVMGLYQGEFGLFSLYASVFKAWMLASALFFRMRDDRVQRNRAQADHTTELERRLAYEAQLRHVLSHHARYGMPNQALLDEAVNQFASRGGQSVAVWVIRLNRYACLESLCTTDTLADMVKDYCQGLSQWLLDRDDLRLIEVGGAQHFAALDDSTLAFLSEGTPTPELISDLNALLTRRFEWQGLFVAWDAHVGLAVLDGLLASVGLGVTDEARMALQWSNGHERVVRFDADRMKREKLAYGLTLDLEGAIDRGELLLHYQPKVTVKSGRTDSMEALVRWRHPERGMIPPCDFIAEAEATGVINRLTMWAIAEAGRFALTLDDAAVRISVNITAFDLATPRFVTDVLAALSGAGCPPHRLILEVTESAALTDQARAVEILTQLRKEGIHIALDDFGTGYSSLGILQDMPLDEMKVDRSFVTNIMDVPRKQAVLLAMIEVGHRLGLTVTIEGVESEDSVNWLRQHGCDVVQGYVFSRPLDEQAARQWLTTRSARTTERECLVPLLSP
jgi:EAL domain-containing protein (putative c-di-GMP-specific phosphodiesterase class I)